MSGRAIELLDIIRSRGVRLAIDDFGTGYSSMSLMKKFPVDTIKIDRSFVQDLPHDSEDRAIAQAIISMGKALGLTVIAEGVETADQATFLREHDCDEMQGYLFSRPVPAEAHSAILLKASGLLPSASRRWRRQARAQRFGRCALADAGVALPRRIAGHFGVRVARERRLSRTARGHFAPDGLRWRPSWSK